MRKLMRVHWFAQGHLESSWGEFNVHLSCVWDALSFAETREAGYKSDDS